MTICVLLYSSLKILVCLCVEEKTWSFSWSVTTTQNGLFYVRFSVVKIASFFKWSQKDLWMVMKTPNRASPKLIRSICLFQISPLILFQIRRQLSKMVWSRSYKVEYVFVRPSLRGLIKYLGRLGTFSPSTSVLFSFIEVYIRWCSIL